VKETYTMALIDSGASLGQVVAYTAMEMAVEKARGAGVAIVGGQEQPPLGLHLATSRTLLITSLDSTS